MSPPCDTYLNAGSLIWQKVGDRLGVLVLSNSTWLAGAKIKSSYDDDDDDDDDDDGDVDDSDDDGDVGDGVLVFNLTGWSKN